MGRVLTVSAECHTTRWVHSWPSSMKGNEATAGLCEETHDGGTTLTPHCICSVESVNSSWLLQGPAPTSKHPSLCQPKAAHLKLKGDVGDLAGCPKSSRPGIEAYTCDLSIWSGEPGGPPWVWGQLGLGSEFPATELQIETLSQNQNKTKEQNNENRNLKHIREQQLLHGLGPQVEETNRNLS